MSNDETKGVQNVQNVQNEVVQTKVVQNEDQPKITSEEKPKEKNPKKVAARKSLSAISKAAKEEKMRKLLQEEPSLTRYAIIAVGLSVVGYASYKYFFTQNKPPEPHELKVHVEMSPEPKTTEKKKKRGKPISMFD